jgi:hypothetical protein
MLFSGLREGWRQSGVSAAIQMATSDYPHVFAAHGIEPMRFSVDLVDQIWKHRRPMLQQEFGKARDFATAFYCMAVFVEMERDLPLYSYDASVEVLRPALRRYDHLLETDPSRIIRRHADYLAIDSGHAIMEIVVRRRGYHLIDLAEERLGTSEIITDEEVGSFAATLEARLPSVERPVGGWYPRDVLRAIHKL